jgi:hypothetical protein
MKHGRALVILTWLAADGTAHAAPELKDPTRPPAAVAAAPQAPKPAALPCVSAIFVSAARRVAIFDGQPVQAGDQVGAYRIDTITATGVGYRLGTRLAFAPLTPLPDRAPTPPRNP